MIRCNENPRECIPCCDFCIHAEHDIWEENGKTHTGGPIGCKLHEDKEHQETAQGCGYCDDYHCSRADKASGKWFEGWSGLG